MNFSFHNNFNFISDFNFQLAFITDRDKSLHELYINFIYDFNFHGKSCDAGISTWWTGSEVVVKWERWPAEW
jgi:hypothetical protein